MTETPTSWVPHRKWAVSTVGALGTLMIMWVTTGTWDVEESVGAITLAVTAISTYLIPNKPDTSLDNAP